MEKDSKDGKKFQRWKKIPKMEKIFLCLSFYISINLKNWTKKSAKTCDREKKVKNEV
ncbi:MAG: hypothetical protein LBF22_05855 [Deltaproteobacteria bacterium]|jgi:hypothetical protein|nr:hypothetical protein [Deltaproteobacteria bacterium]